jgi:carboxyl-terminal processing protease
MVETTSKAKETHEETLKSLAVFGTVFERISTDYVEQPKSKDLVESAINGMLTSLDPHSVYLNKDDMEAMRTQIAGEFGGLGIEIIMDMGLVKVVSPLDDSPAFLAGMKSGDYIFAINNEPVMGLSSTEAVKKMRGEAGSKVHLSIMREGQKEPVEVDVIRQIIKSNPVKAKMDENIAYIRINSFTEKTTQAVEAELSKISKQLSTNLKGVVLDLRNNPGGLLDQAVGVSDLFLDAGEIVSIKGKSANAIKRYMATAGDLLKNIRIVVLINEGSASAAEIVAGALQDNKRAVIMGAKSFGKASVQSVMPLQDIIPMASDYGAVKMTTARYYTPSGRSLQAEGIIPDITVVQSKVEAIEPKDIKKMLFSEANLKGHLLSDNKKDSKVKQDKAVAVTPIVIKSEERLQIEQDYQLARAVDLLKALSLVK